MNIYIMVDMEGISGITLREQVVSDGSKYQEGRQLLTRDINVVARACKEAGAKKIFVNDRHGGGQNVIWSDLAPEIDACIIGNLGDSRFPCLEECDAVILLGYHAMAGTPGGTLEHTFSSGWVQNLYINEKKCGELAIDSAIVGECGKPVILVTGDDKACKEAEAFLPNVTTACVKHGISWNGGILLPPEKAYSLLRQKTIDAINNARNVAPVILPKPITMRIEVIERGNMPNQLKQPYVKIIDGRTFEVSGNTMLETLFRAF